MRDSEHADEAVRAAYRGLPREEPPSAIDAVVLGAARHSVVRPTPRWRVPVALAAVLVLSVGVALRVEDEQPEIRMAPPSPPASVEATKPMAPKVESKADTPVAGPAPQAKTRVRPALPPARPLARQEPSAPAKEEKAVSPAFVPSPRADSEQRQAQTASEAAAAEAGQSAGQLAQPAARADRGAPMMAKRSAEAPNLASGPAVTPEAWLERIIELRASGRHKEADESYAEFRRRFPDYPIPSEKLQKIAPPR